MIDENLARLRAHRNNIHRYRRLLATRLTDLERAYVERRLSEERASMEALGRDVSARFQPYSAPLRISAREPSCLKWTLSLSGDVAKISAISNACATPKATSERQDGYSRFQE